MACKKGIEVNFNVTPEEPKAGESVKFENVSSGGEDWEWNFGDGMTSTLKSPSHTYKKPGDYIVRLTVNKKNSLTRTRKLTVYDTIPNFSCEAEEFFIYTDYTFKAQVYNPYNYTVSYEWFCPMDNMMNLPCLEITDSVLTNATLHAYFTRPASEARVGLRVILNGDTTEIVNTYAVNDLLTHSVLSRTPDGDYRQRIFGSKYTPVQLWPDGLALLDAEQDTAQTYNGVEFLLSDLQSFVPEMQGFHIANRKLYFRDDKGLWVANIDGASFPVPIDTSAVCYAMTLDKTDNRIYWANADGVWYMPFVGSDNNRFVTTPTRLNTLTSVTKLACDPEKK